MSDLTFTQGDTAPSIYGTLTIQGVVVDLTGATVKFQMRLAIDRRYAVDADAAVEGTPTNGQVRYDWEDADLSEPGDYLSYWQIIRADDTVQHTVPWNTITVNPA